MEHDLSQVMYQLKLERRARGVSQAELASMTGIAKKTISRLENGHDIPKFDTVERLASTLGFGLQITLVKK